jgi:hypothetical protein
LIRPLNDFSDFPSEIILMYTLKSCMLEITIIYKVKMVTPMYLVQQLVYICGNYALSFDHYVGVDTHHPLAERRYEQRGLL